MALNRLQAGRTALALAAMGALIACGGHPAQPTNAAAKGLAAGEADYKAPPELTGAAAQAGGSIALVGRAAPGAAVRLASPAGAAQFASAGADGGWRIAIPPSGAARLFSLSMSDGGQVVQAIGYLFVTPEGLAVRLRAGGGSEAIVPRGGTTWVLTLEYDNQRAATLTGHASPGAALSLRVDGVERGQATVDPQGRFTLPLSQPPLPGDHEFDLAGDDAELRFSAPIGAPAPLGRAPFIATRQGAGWRVDWLTPGGGEQTTLVLPVQAG